MHWWIHSYDYCKQTLLTVRESPNYPAGGDNVSKKILQYLIDALHPAVGLGMVG